MTDQQLAPDRAEVLMPESERACPPWDGPGLGNGATVSRRIQTGTSLTYPGNERGVCLCKQCDGRIMEGDWMGWRTVTPKHTMVDCVLRVGMGNGRGHSGMPVGGPLTDALISGSNLTA
eukprot:3940453-Rhodomonas_salina.2